MAQGIIGGGTSYEGQSVKDVLSDINLWIEYTESTLKTLEENILYLKTRGFWNKIPFNFQMTLTSTIKCQETNLHDFAIISESICKDSITKKEVSLLWKIGTNAIEFNAEYGRNYNEECGWKDYGNHDFKVAENSYADGRDYFVTLQDATNASSRLEDYIGALSPVITNHISQQVTGDMNVVAGINNGGLNIENNNYNNFEEESERAIQEIEKLEDINPNIKEFIRNLLLETTDAIKANDKAKQEKCKTNYKAFWVGAGAKISNLIAVLASFASIASFFGITL